MIEPDFIPEQGGVCAKCKFYTVCPYDWECATLKRLELFEAYENVCHGNSTESLR